MGNVSYSAHISNGKSAITSKKALAGVAKHNLRKYKSADYSSDNIRLIYGTTDLFQDVKRVYHREFDDVVKEYNSRQKREDRKIKDYFEHVAGLNQDMAVEIIFQCGDKKYWDEHWKNKNYMSEVFDYILECLQKLLPEFKIANAVIHFDEASPHMHVVGVPVWEGAKRGLSKKVSKRNVFTPQTLSVILQDKLRAEASYGCECYFKEQLAEKIGVSRQAISKWEGGLSTPELDKLKALSECFQITIDELTENKTTSASGGPAAQERSPAPRQAGESKTGVCLCIIGAVCLILFGILTLTRPSAVDQIDQSSMVTLNGTRILIALFALLMILGITLIFRKK